MKMKKLFEILVSKENNDFVGNNVRYYVIAKDHTEAIDKALNQRVKDTDNNDYSKTDFYIKEFQEIASSEGSLVI